MKCAGCHLGFDLMRTQHTFCFRDSFLTWVKILAISRWWDYLSFLKFDFCRFLPKLSRQNSKREKGICPNFWRVEIPILLEPLSQLLLSYLLVTKSLLIKSWNCSKSVYCKFKISFLVIRGFQSESHFSSNSLISSSVNSVSSVRTGLSSPLKVSVTLKHLSSMTRKWATIVVNLQSSESKNSITIFCFFSLR